MSACQISIYLLLTSKRRANATIYNDVPYTYLGSHEYQVDMCAADPGSVPLFSTEEDFCQSQACFSDQVRCFHLVG